MEEKQKEKQNVLRQLGERIRKLRKEKGMSQEKFADESGVERSYMGAIERGERNPTFIKLYMIAKALKVSLPHLFEF